MAKFTARRLRRKKQFRSLTGVEVATFDRDDRTIKLHSRKRVVETKNHCGPSMGRVVGLKIM